MKLRYRILGRLLAALLIGYGLIGLANTTSGEQSSLQTLLLVDATKTFSSTARVGALAGAIRSTGLFDLSVRFSAGTCLYEDPLACDTDLPAEPFDLAVIIPRGIDDRSAQSIWVVTNIMPWSDAEGFQAVTAVEAMIDQIFAGLAQAVDPTSDLWPAFAASLYRTQGWIR